MREQILLNIDNPGQLEKLYRNDKPSFKTAFNLLYPQFRENPLAEGWHERLNYHREDLTWGTAAERTFVLIISALAAFMAKMPQILSVNEEFYYTRNIVFIVFPMLIAYFVWKNRISKTVAAGLAGFIVLAAIYINLLPGDDKTDTLVLACLHLALILWVMLGFVLGGANPRADWLGFIRYNGELAVMMAVLLISGGLTTAITMGLFEISGLDIKKFYFENIVVCGLAAVPIVATFLTRAQPALVGKVSPVIAKLFSPVALVMLVVYLVATAISGKSPYHDREFLLLFNLLLVGVMALIFFSIAEGNESDKSKAQVLILFLLSAVTLVVNGVALSAVLFRISEWGITPNRAAVLGANVLMLIHLLVVAFRLFGVLTRSRDLSLVGRSLNIFLPVYFGWAVIVTFLFPVLFGFK